MPTSRFTVPAPDRTANPATITEPARVRDWVANLPYADLAGVTRAVLEALTRLNRHPHKVTERAELMGAYCIPCARLIRVPLSRPNTPSSREMRQLMTEMAYGYKHLINETLQQSGWKQRKRLVHSLYFVAKHLSLELFLAYEAYECTVTNSWRELLTIYRQAEQQELLDEPAEDRDQGDPANATINHVLKRILLLKLLDPCRMVPGETRACFDYLNTLASEAVVENLQQMTNPAGRFLLDLNGIDNPAPPDPDKQPQNPERYRYLNLVPVSRQVHQQLQQMEAQGAPPPEGLRHMLQLSPILVLKRMLLAWHSRQERRNARMESFGWMLCGCGLGAAHHFLQQQQNNTSPDSSPADEQSTVEEVDLADIPVQQHQPSQYNRIRCRQINRSVSGICVRLQLPKETNPKVGQVLVLEDEVKDRTGNSYPGIVRRCLRIDEETLEIGIQFIRGETHPIEIRPEDAEEGAAAQPALWVNRGNDRLSSILLPRGLYRKGRRFIVTRGRPGKMIEARQLVETSPSFERFQFLVVKS